MKLLVTTDGSDRSLDVLPHAAGLAHMAGAGIVLLRVFDPEEAAEARGDQPYHEAVADAAADVEAEMVETLKRFGVAGDALAMPLLQGEPVFAAILRAAVEVEPLLIAMSTGGSGAMHHAILGSTAAEVAKHAVEPLLLAGHSTKVPGRQPFDRLVIATDGDACSDAVLMGLEAIFRRWRPRTTVMTVEVDALGAGEAEHDAAEQLVHRLAKALPSDMAVDEDVVKPVSMERIADTIVDRAVQLHADAIAIASHARGRVGHLLLGSVGQEVVGRSPLPTLVVRRAG